MGKGNIQRERTEKRPKYKIIHPRTLDLGRALSQQMPNFHFKHSHDLNLFVAGLPSLSFAICLSQRHQSLLTALLDELL
jgi:hypothetical protein